jgi:squalene-hopene/tetraprenyl-beta-curcumene cyclase
MRNVRAFVVVLGIILAMTARAPGETNVAIAGTPGEVQAPKYDPKEPVAARMSLARSAAYLDNMAAFWMQRKEVPHAYGQQGRNVLTSCGSCHANFSYLMVRPLLVKEFPKSQMDETRRWMEKRTASFERLCREKPRLGPMFREEDGMVGYSALEFVSMATALVFYDAQTTGKLHPSTRSALTKMWALQNGAGDWNPLDHCAAMAFPVAEFDPYYGATLAALATGMAPEDYAKTSEARAGLAKLRTFFKNNPAPGAHHQAMLLWASQRTEGLMTRAERTATIKDLLKLQREDGGWSSSALKPGRYSQRRFNDSGSDGYGTAFVVYVLRQAGLPASRPEIARGVTWLKSRQRVSGNWFTAHALGHDQPEGGLGTRGLSMTNLATAFAVMALKACEESEGSVESSRKSRPKLERPFPRSAD